MNNERDGFEAWIFRDIPNDLRGSALSGLRNSMAKDGNYSNPLMQAFWEGWQARATLSTPASRESK